MDSTTHASLAYLFDRFEALEKQCIQTLGRAKALHFVELANDWIDITQAIGRTYPQSVLNQSLVLASFLFLFKEVQWLHLHFVCGNYPLVGRSLRFLWEMMYRAYYADTAAQESLRGLTLAERVQWLNNQENQLGWSNCVAAVLTDVVPLTADEDSRYAYYHKMWRELNNYAHPSVDLLSRMMTESSVFITDQFDYTWAEESSEFATAVFDLIWLAVLRRFPECLPLLAKNEYGLICPLSQSVISIYRVK